MDCKITNFKEFEKIIKKYNLIQLMIWKNSKKKSFIDFIFYILKASKYQEYIDFILEKVDLNMQEPRFGWTLLHLAAGNNEPEIVKLLIDNGANPNITSNKGYTALSFTKKKIILKNYTDGDPLTTDLLKIQKIIGILQPLTRIVN